jgi:ribosomal protein S18 acetylase RimI-like enzyme
MQSGKNMHIQIREAQAADLDILQDFTERSFEPIFESFASILGRTIFAKVFPDWRNLQRSHVTTFYNDEQAQLWIATVDDVPAGLIVYKLNDETKQGVVEFLVVDPDYQNQGNGTQLNQFVIEQMRAAGMELIEVGTGGDISHAPARHAYEKVGYVGIPSVYYYKSLVD